MGSELRRWCEEHGVDTPARLVIETAAPVHRVLRLAREHLGMELSWLSQSTGPTLVTQFVDGDAGGFRVSTGMSTPTGDSYCQRVLDGGLPAVIPDTNGDPETRELPTTRDHQFGAYVGAPVILPDGQLYGMLCGVSRLPDQSLRTRDGDSMRNFADMLAETIAAYYTRHGTEDEFHGHVEAMLDSGGIRIALQPIVDLTNQRTVAVEALARFPAGTYTTEDWFHQARQAGCQIELELDAAEAALHQLPFVPAGQRLAVNTSADLITSDRFVAMLDRHPGERLIAEVTEHNIATNIGAFLDAVGILRSRGVLIAIDDAGTGYASLQQILQVGPDIIKLDRALVSDVDSDPLKRALASAFVTFAGEAKTMLIAEGVETVSELHALQDLGVAFAQGYVCAPPLLVDELRPA